MSHKENFEIPARLEFRPFRADWTIVQGEFVGWGQQKSPYMSERPLKNRLLYDAVEIRIPSVGESGSSCIVELERMVLPCHLLASHETPKNTPEFDGRKIEMVISQLPSREIPESSDEPLRDPWKMREEYFEIEEGNSRSLCDFLSKWGLWSHFFRHVRDPRQIVSEPTFARSIVFQDLPWLAVVLPHRFWQERELLRRALIGSSRKWLSSISSFDGTAEMPFWLGSHSALGFKVANEPPFCILERSYCQEAVRTTISIDHLSNVSFGICKRQDCRKLFERTTQQKRMYCSPECAHLANVRKLRADQRRSSAKRKGNSRNAKG